jgi:hypothetical protein
MHKIYRNWGAGGETNPDITELDANTSKTCGKQNVSETALCASSMTRPIASAHFNTAPQ